MLPMFFLHHGYAKFGPNWAKLLSNISCIYEHSVDFDYSVNIKLCMMCIFVRRVASVQFEGWSTFDPPPPSIMGVYETH